MPDFPLDPTSSPIPRVDETSPTLSPSPRKIPVHRYRLAAGGSLAAASAEIPCFDFHRRSNYPPNIIVIIILFAISTSNLRIIHRFLVAAASDLETYCRFRGDRLAWK
jgi:hypothetical protein